MSTGIAHVVVFSELSPRARTQYTRFLIERNVQFVKRPSDGRYVANIRLEMPPDKSSLAGTSSRRAATVPVSPREQSPPVFVQGDDNEEDGEVDDWTDTPASPIAAVDPIPTELARYTPLIRQFGARILGRTSVGTYTSESKLVRLMNEIYDARNEDEGVTPSDKQADSFAAFIAKYLTNRFGLRSLVEQQAWELIQGLKSRSRRSDVELFTAFVEGKYQARTLELFLTARDAAQQATTATLFRLGTAVAGRSKRPSRRASGQAGIPPPWLSKAQVESIALTIFDSKTDDTYLNFVHDVRAFLAEQNPERTLRDLLDVQEFLTLAVATHARSCVELDDSSAPPTALVSPSPSVDELSARAQYSHAPLDSTTSMDTSPSPSPLPPPPLPRSFGAPTPSEPTRQTRKPSKSNLPATRLYEPPPAPQSTSSSKHRPANSQGMRSATIATNSYVANALRADDDVQQRLGSLLERMKQRRSERDTGALR